LHFQNGSFSCNFLIYWGNVEFYTRPLSNVVQIRSVCRGCDRMVVGFTYAISAHRLSPLMLWVRISIRTRCTTLCDKVCQWLAADWCFFPGSPVSSTKYTDRHDITEILLKVALNTIKQTNIIYKLQCFYHE
jgi:hypothetical protein